MIVLLMEVSSFGSRGQNIQHASSLKYLYIAIAVLVIALLALGTVLAYFLVKKGSDKDDGKGSALSEDQIEYSDPDEADSDENDGSSGVEFIEDDRESPDEESDTSNTVVVDLYFYMGPLEVQQSTDNIHKVERRTDKDDIYSYIIESMISGPNEEESTAGYIPVFRLSGLSTCGSVNYEYKIDTGVMKVKLCKDIDLVYDTEDAYAGITLNAQSRVVYSFVNALSIGEVRSVELYGSDGSCYAPDTGHNTCEWGDAY